MITTLIVEDDIIQLNAIEAVLEEEFPTMKVLKATTYNAAVELLTKHTIHLFLLDIELDQYDKTHTGLTLGQFIRENSTYQHTPILFLTAVMGEVQTALNTTHCYNYLTKPYMWSELIASIRSLIDSPLLHSQTQEKSMSLQDVNGIYFQCLFSDLYYIKSENKTLTLYIKNNFITTRNYTIEHMLELLPDHFCRCHKSYIVNLQSLNNYDKTTQIISLNDKKHTTIPVGRKYKTDLERSLLKYV